MALLIVVTRQDIDSASHTSTNCPIARALHRQGFPSALVTRKEVVTNDGRRFELPKDVAAKISTYDRGHDGEGGPGIGVMEPFKFTLGGE